LCLGLGLKSGASFRGLGLRLGFGLELRFGGGCVRGVVCDSKQGLYVVVIR